MCVRRLGNNSNLFFHLTCCFLACQFCYAWTVQPKHDDDTTCPSAPEVVGGTAWDALVSRTMDFMAEFSLLQSNAAAHRSPVRSNAASSANPTSGVSESLGLEGRAPNQANAEDLQPSQGEPAYGALQADASIKSQGSERTDEGVKGDVAANDEETALSSMANVIRARFSSISAMGVGIFDSFSRNSIARQAESLIGFEPGSAQPRKPSGLQPQISTVERHERSAMASAAGGASIGNANYVLGKSAVAAGEGDVVQGLVFTLICLIIVIGIYLLAFNDHRPGEVAYPMAYDRADANKSATSCFPWSSSAPPASALLPARPAGSWYSRSQLPSAIKLGTATSLAGRDTLRAADATMLREKMGMPGTPQTVADMQERFGSFPASKQDEWHSELPTLYKQLVMPVAHTRLAVPLVMLSGDAYEVDILGLSGTPLLLAVLKDSGYSKQIEISMSGVGTLAAVVTSDLEIKGHDGKICGRLKRDCIAPHVGISDGPHLVLRDKSDRPILMFVTTRRDAVGCDFKMSSVSAGRMVERATAVRRPPTGKLPADHYEVVANPNVDAVLALAVLLATVTFESPVPQLEAPPESGRPSMMYGNSDIYLR